jgi:hypothetical protein
MTRIGPWRVMFELATGWVIFAVGGQLLAARIHHVPFSAKQAVIDAIIWAVWVALRCVLCGIGKSPGGKYATPAK